MEWLGIGKIKAIFYIFGGVFPRIQGYILLICINLDEFNKKYSLQSQKPEPTKRKSETNAKKQKCKKVIFEESHEKSDI